MKKQPLRLTGLIIALFLIFANLKIFKVSKPKPAPSVVVDLQYSWDGDGEECIELSNTNNY